MSTSADREDWLDPVAVVGAWRERGAAAVDPVKFCVIEGLARRAAAQRGEARLQIVRRIEALWTDHAAARSGGVQGQPLAVTSAAAALAATRHAALAGLGELVDRLGRSRALPMPASLSQRPANGRDTEASRLASSSPTASPPPLNAVAAFKGTWSRLRAEQRLRQALAQVPARAGPMNSSNVMNQALQAMHELSPAYLDAFMLHVDGLLWLEQSSGGAGFTPQVPQPAASAEGRRRHQPRGARKR